MDKTVLKAWASYWQQAGVSIWLNEDGDCVMLAEWKAFPAERRKETDKKRLAQWVKQGFSENVSRMENGDLALFACEKWAVVFRGDPEKARPFESVMPGMLPWFDGLKEHRSYHRKEDFFHSLMTVAHSMVSSIQSERILDLILEHSIQTIPSADTGFLFLYDENIQKLLVRSAVGFRMESYTLTRLSPGEGISGKVFQTGEPMLITGADNVEQAMANMSDSNHRYYQDSTIYASYPISAISVPLNYKENCIGVLTLDNFMNEEPFSPEDLELLQAFADLAAVVIEHSGLFQKVYKQNEELTLIHQALSKEHDRLQKTIDFHNQLTNLAAKGSGIKAILSALHQAVRVPVAVYDRLLMPVAKCPEDAGLALPEQFLKHPAMKLVNKTRKWQRADSGDDTIMVIPIIGTDRMLGYLCAWTRSEAFIDIGKLILEYSATVIALEWIKKEAIRESQERIKGQFLEEVLAGEMNARLIQQAAYLGLEQNHYYSALLVQGYPNGHADSPRGGDWISFLYDILDARGVFGLVVPRGNTRVIIISYPEDMSLEKRMDVIRALMDNFQKQKGLQTAIGRIYRGLSHVHKSYRDAQQCMELFDRHRIQTPVLYYGDLGVIRFFLQQDREELENYLQEVLGPVFAYDREKNSRFFQTLHAYVRHDKDLGTVTRELNIHYNTLYYRINRVQEILGCTFDRQEDWFNVKLACQIYQFLSEEGQKTKE